MFKYFIKNLVFNKKVLNQTLTDLCLSVGHPQTGPFRGNALQTDSESDGVRGKTQIKTSIQ